MTTQPTIIPHPDPARAKLGETVLQLASGQRFGPVATGMADQNPTVIQLPPRHEEPMYQDHRQIRNYTNPYLFPSELLEPRVWVVTYDRREALLIAVANRDLDSARALLPVDDLPELDELSDDDLVSVPEINMDAVD